MFSFGFLLRGLWCCALRLAVLVARGLGAPGAVVAECRGAVEVVLVVEAVGGVILCVLQPGDETLVLIPKLPPHQGGLAHHHHVRYLTGEAEVAGWTALLAVGIAHAAVGTAGRVLPFPPLRRRLSCGLSFFVICGKYFRFEVLWVTSWGSHHSLPFLEQACLQTVPGAEAVGLVTRHELLHGLQDDTQPEVVEGEVGQAHAGDVFRELLQHLRVLCVHGQYASRDEFSVLADGEVPSLDPHQVIEGKF